MTEAIIGSKGIDALLRVLTAIAALNWALVEFAETDLLLDLLELSGTTLQATYAAIGVASVIVVYNTLVSNGYLEG